MRRVVILGPGASGKSTLARDLGANTGLPVIELDKIFWQPGLAPMSRPRWIEVQLQLVTSEAWILDGDLGPYDAVEIRLGAADTVVFLDLSLLRCAWRAIRRSPERHDFWLWLASYRWKSRPQLLATIARCAPTAQVHVLRTPKSIREFISSKESV